MKQPPLQPDYEGDYLLGDGAAEQHQHRARHGGRGQDRAYGEIGAGELEHQPGDGDVVEEVAQ